MVVHCRTKHNQVIASDELRLHLKNFNLNN